jgi:hypothetical protein
MYAANCTGIHAGPVGMDLGSWLDLLAVHGTVVISRYSVLRETFKPDSVQIRKSHASLTA